MAGKINIPNFQMVGVNGVHGMVDDNHLGQLFQIDRQRAADTIVLLQANVTGNNTLETFLNQFPTREFEDDTEFYWDVLSGSARNYPLVEARDENGQVVSSAVGANVGAGTTRFQLVFDEPAFHDGEVIVGTMNEKYLFRVLETPQIEGSRYVYLVELMGGNTIGVPRSLLLPGERFSKEYAPVENELSRKVGGVSYNTPVSMRGEWTTLRIFDKIPGMKAKRKVAFGIPMVKEDPKTGRQIKGTSNYWMDYEDWQLSLEWANYKNRALAFGRTNRNINGEYLNFGKSGNVIRMGSGIFEQAEAGLVRYYNDTSSIMDYILDSLYELSEGKIPFGQRKFVIKTGERGALLFNRAAQQQGSGWLPLGLQYSDNNPGALTTVSAAFAPGTAMRLTNHQITEWQAPNGVFVKIDVDTFYDDKVRNKILHPEGGVAFSYRFDIWYIGAEDTPNIQKCAIKGQPESWGYMWGMRNSFTGATFNPNMSYDEDSSEVHRMATLGAVVYDPTRCISIIPSILQ